jgi:hypothetical protein
MWLTLSRREREPPADGISCSGIHPANPDLASANPIAHFCMTQGTFPLLLGEKAGMREVIYHPPTSTPNRFTKSAGRTVILTSRLTDWSVQKIRRWPLTLTLSRREREQPADGISCSGIHPAYPVLYCTNLVAQLYKTQGTFPLLLGEKAGMREVIYHPPTSTPNRFTKSAGRCQRRRRRRVRRSTRSASRCATSARR